MLPSVHCAHSSPIWGPPGFLCCSICHTSGPTTAQAAEAMVAVCGERGHTLTLCHGKARPSLSRSLGLYRAAAAVDGCSKEQALFVLLAWPGLYVRTVEMVAGSIHALTHTQPTNNGIENTHTSTRPSPACWAKDCAVWSFQRKEMHKPSLQMAGYLLYSGRPLPGPWLKKKADGT